jgi:hypothetical protein
MQDMARYGRNGDTRMAHVAPGEVVVPQEVLAQRPQVARGLGMAFRDVGADPRRYVVGSKRNSINPITGEPEFFLDKLIAFGTKMLGNPTVQGAVSNLALQAIRGKKPSLRDALIGGAIGGGLGAVTGRGTGFDALDALLGADVEKAAGSKTSALDAITNKMNADAASKLETPSVERAKGLLGIGEMFNTDVKSPIGRILNTKIGESLAMGLGSQLLDSLFSEEEDPDPYGMMERFNRGAGQGPVKFRPVERKSGTARDLMYAAEGGPAYFPRRNGGIMPNEGSGTKDDVPAMLTAGEFVMTRDAVKGAGNGNLNKGIQKMYGMMDKLEDMA